MKNIILALVAVVVLSHSNSAVAMSLNLAEIMQIYMGGPGQDCGPGSMCTNDGDICTENQN